MVHVCALYPKSIYLTMKCKDKSPILHGDGWDKQYVRKKNYKFIVLSWFMIPNTSNKTRTTGKY